MRFVGILWLCFKQQLRVGFTHSRAAYIVQSVVYIGAVHMYNMHNTIIEHVNVYARFPLKMEGTEGGVSVSSAYRDVCMVLSFCFHLERARVAMSSMQARKHTVLPLTDIDGYTIPFGASIQASLVLPPESAASHGQGESRRTADLCEKSDYNNAWDINQLQSIIPSDPRMTAKVSSQKDDAAPCDGHDSGGKAVKRRYIPLSVPETVRPREELQVRPLQPSQSHGIDISIVLEEQP